MSNFNPLPIHQVLTDIHQRLGHSPSVVLAAEPGAGKSTALPLSLLSLAHFEQQKIVMLEPRRVAAKSIAHYLAAQLDEKVGEQVGYRVRNDQRVSKRTRLEIVTEGILIRQLQQNPELNDIGLLIFDEFHERSLQGDLALFLASEVQQTLREDLRLLVMSATMDTRQIADYLGTEAIIECPGRGHPIHIEFQGTSKQPLSKKVTNALRLCLQQNRSGDILIFLPGQSDIKRCITATQQELPETHDSLLLPLYGALPLTQQEKALRADSQGQRRIIFSTNIAETSLTIDGITQVIDCGLEKQLVFDPGSGMTRLHTQRISKASAKQRAGRAGRTQAGHCLRLWGENEQGQLADFQTPDIKLADLSGLLLDLACWGYANYNQIPWLTPPPQANFDLAQQLLIELELVDDNGKVTALGQQARESGLPPRLATMVLRAEDEQQQLLACDLAALLEDADILAHEGNTDITVRLLAIQEYRQDRKLAMQQYPIKRAAIEQLLKNSQRYRQQLNLSTKSVREQSLDDLQHLACKSLVHAFPDRIAQCRSNNASEYLLANGRGASLPEADSLVGNPWLIVADSDGQKSGGRILRALPAQWQQLGPLLEHRIRSEESYHFDADREKLSGLRRETYQAITLKSTPLSEIPETLLQEKLPDILQQAGLTLLNWTPACRRWLERVQWLGQNLPEFPQISEQWLLNNLSEWLLPYLSNVTSIAELKRVELTSLLTGLLSWDEQTTLSDRAPERYTAPSGSVVPIVYDPQQGPKVSLQLQEIFGEITSPILGHNTPLRFELLSPARRPIQTTSDLANFWQTSYFDIAKEMRGRYPKHRWPEKPLEEKPGRSIKRKKANP